MADTGYSVFAPYAQVAPAVVRGRNELPAIRVDEPACDHRFHLSPLPPRLVTRPVAEAAEDSATRRTKLWEFNQNLHCSIIGTCLSTAELRQTLTRLGLAQADWTDHDLHHKAVSLAARHDQPARLLHKALDRRHKLAISQFGKACTEADVGAQWRDAVKRGDIPGVYWAALTHPATTQALVGACSAKCTCCRIWSAPPTGRTSGGCAIWNSATRNWRRSCVGQQDALHQAIVTRDASIGDLRRSLRDRLTRGRPGRQRRMTAPRCGRWWRIWKSASPPKPAAAWRWKRDWRNSREDLAAERAALLPGRNRGRVVTR